MSRYIDADKLDKEFDEILDNPKEYDKPIHDMLRKFYFAPTEDVEPVKHGRWVADLTNPYGMRYICSECGVGRQFKSDYCPNCGAKMDREEHKND